MQFPLCKPNLLMVLNVSSPHAAYLNLVCASEVHVMLRGVIAGARGLCLQLPAGFHGGGQVGSGMGPVGLEVGCSWGTHTASGCMWHACMLRAIRCSM